MSAMSQSAENDAPVFECCQHCTDYDAGEEWCSQAPHDDACEEWHCSGGRAHYGVIPPATIDDGGAS